MSRKKGNAERFGELVALMGIEEAQEQLNLLKGYDGAGRPPRTRTSNAAKTGERAKPAAAAQTAKTD